MKTPEEMANEVFSGLEKQYPGSTFEHIKDFLIDEIKKRDDQLTQELQAYKEYQSDVKRLTKEIDVIMNGNEAADQASLCDIVSQLNSEYKKFKKPIEWPTDLEIEEDAEKSCNNNWPTNDKETGFNMGYKAGLIEGKIALRDLIKKQVEL